ncbi:MAG: hypothetical protein ACI8R4_002866 [Paracoccaceae bacterium]|jgi:hypothetical protein
MITLDITEVSLGSSFRKGSDDCQIALSIGLAEFAWGTKHQLGFGKETGFAAKAKLATQLTARA